MSIFLVGGASGSLGGSWFADKIGRKGAMMISNLLSALAGLLFFITKSTNSFELLIIARLVVGLSAGKLKEILLDIRNFLFDNFQV